MARPLRLIASFLSLGLPLAPAQAFCEYRGVTNARTTVAQELRDSRWVVRARVLSAVDHHPPDDADDFPSTLYRLQVIRAYKGSPPRRFTFFTERNSGGFYMDRGMEPDIGGEYLLFLTPLTYVRTDPWGGRHRMYVNYTCGQSGPWAEVPEADHRYLNLARS